MTFLVTIFKVDHEIVPLELVAERPESFTELRSQITIARHLGRLHCHIEGKLSALLREQVCWNFQYAAIELTVESDVYTINGLLHIICVLFDLLLDELAKPANQRLPEGVHFDCLDVWQEKRYAFSVVKIDFIPS